jgi:ribosomal protein S18 acetylase RimI-like enzyme
VSIEIRALTADEWPQFRQLRLAALAEAPHAFGARLADWQGDNDREARWRARLSIPGSYTIIALHHGEPAGLASGVPAEDHAIELISMWVRPEARGAGVGDALIREIERWARAGGAPVLKLAVMPDNGPAVRLYTRNGFLETAEAGRDVVMVKELR